MELGIFPIEHLHNRIKRFSKATDWLKLSMLDTPRFGMPKVRKRDLRINDPYCIRIAPVRNESSQGLFALTTDNICVRRSESRSTVNILSTVISAGWCLLMLGIVALAFAHNFQS
jgi:hypothetical protein